MATTILGEPRHYSPQSPTNHFLGLCLECDAHYLARRTLADVETMYRCGQIGQVEWEGFSWLWAVTTDKLGCYDGWKCEPWPDAKVFAGMLAEAYRAVSGREMELPATGESNAGGGVMSDYVLIHPHATRATFHEAKRAFTNGASVVVTERPEGDTKLVYESTTVHNRESCSWEWLAQTVKEWRSRYPRQTFYIVREVAS